MTTRRTVLKGLGGATALTLAGCGNSPPPATATTPPTDQDFDFPVVTPLPFAHGVASGDPLCDRVIIWTRITEKTPSAGSIPVLWFVATDPEMRNVIRSGSQTTSADRDWTVKVDVTNLSAASTYYYAFAALGARSITGRTRTAPDSAVSEIRVAVVACSSYWSSYWSGFGQIADRNDLDLVIHCGDYIYDFVDEDETVRARRDLKDTGYVDYRDWLNIDELRRRYALWRSDPNLLRAHQQHPWFLVWDNHDISESYGNELPTPLDGSLSETTLDQVCRVFYEWTPSRPVQPDGSGSFIFVEDGGYPAAPDYKFVYRKLPYGPLLDIYGVDTQIYLPNHGLPVDSSHLAAGSSLFNRDQYQWLSKELLASQQRGVTWRLINNQTWIAPIGVPSPDGPPSDPIGLTRWADYTEERAALFDFMRGGNDAGTRIRNNIVVSGDVHGNWASDLINDNSLSSGHAAGPAVPNSRGGSTAANAAAGYGRASTGNLGPVNLRADSVGVEFAPSSMGRGGADELIANASGGGSEASNIAGARAIEAAVINGNSNCQFIEWVDHGYGIVDLNAERAIFEFWWQDKLTPDSPGVLGYQMIAWAQEDSSGAVGRFQDQIDNVTAHGLPVAATRGSRSAEPAPEGMLSPA